MRNKVNKLESSKYTVQFIASTNMKIKMSTKMENNEKKRSKNKDTRPQRGKRY